MKDADVDARRAWRLSRQFACIVARVGALSLLRTSLSALKAILPRHSSAPSPLARALSNDEARVIDETLDALQIPRENVPIWLAHNRAFCERHGGRRVYGELMDVLDACDHVHRETRAQTR